MCPGNWPPLRKLDLTGYRYGDISHNELIPRFFAFIEYLFGGTYEYVNYIVRSFMLVVWVVNRPPLHAI